ncbi:MAG: hypothetical protein AAF353_11100 [Pseudomonadota bacterium]
MKNPGLFDGILVAALISIAAGVFSLIFGGFILFSHFFYLILCAASFTYLLYLMKRAEARIGKLVVFSAWFIVSLCGWLLEAALIEQILLQAGLIWIVRSLYFHHSLFSAALDFGLVSIGLVAATWALMNTGSLAAALWTFFLLQSFFCWLPQMNPSPTHTKHPSRAERSDFQSAHRVASEALRKLAQP